MQRGDNNLEFVYGLIVGVFAGGAASYLYAQKVINAAKAVAAAGQAVKKAL